MGSLAERTRRASLADLLQSPLEGSALAGQLSSAIRPLAGRGSSLRFYPAAIEGTARASAARPFERVLLVGLDGADWDLIDPLMEQGKLPHIKAVIARGARARLRALTPILSPLLWTSIATGVGPQRHGITDFLAASRETGAEIPVTSSMRRVKAIWNIASEHGLSSGIIGWWATWPAERVSGFIVSDRVTAPLLGQTEPTGALRRLTWPEALSLSIQPMVVPAAEIAPADIDPFLVPTAPPPANDAEQRRSLAATLATARTYQEISLRLLDAYQPDLAAVYFAGTDTIAHQFMRYRAPSMAGVTSAEQRAWGLVVDRYYEHQDRLLGDLLRAADPDTLVIICSDHGFKTGSSRPQTDPRIGVGAAADWHRRFGVLVIAGPGVRSGARLDDASILDVAPTVLAALGLPVAEGLEGRVLEEAFVTPLPAVRAPGYEMEIAAGAPVPEASPMDDEVVARLRALGYIAPEGANALNNQGVILMDAGRLAEAAEAFTLALRQEPRFLYAIINLGRAQLLMKRYDDALASFSGALELEPQRVETLDLLGNTRMEQGDLAKAEELFVRALRLAPDDAGTRNSLGLLYQRQGRLGEAAAEFERVVAIDADYVEGHNNLGLVRRQQGEPALAIAAFQKAISVDAAFAGSYNNMGLALQDLGRSKEARGSYAAGLAVDPDNAVLLNNLGALDLVEGSFDAARHLFEKAINADPDYPSARNNLGALEEQLGNREAARAQYEAAAGSDPRYLDARLNLARLDMQDGQLDQAARRLDGILAQDPAYPQALIQKGFLMLSRGASDKARQFAEAAIKIQPALPDAHNLLAEVHLGSGRFQEAIREMKRSLKLNPNQPRVADALRRAEASSP